MVFPKRSAFFWPKKVYFHRTLVSLLQRDQLAGYIPPFLSSHTMVVNAIFHLFFPILSSACWPPSAAKANFLQCKKGAKKFLGVHLAPFRGVAHHGGKYSAIFHHFSRAPWWYNREIPLVQKAAVAGGRYAPQQLCTGLPEKSPLRVFCTQG